MKRSPGWVVRTAQAILVVVIVWGVARGITAGGAFRWSDLTGLRPAPAPLLLSFVLLVAVYVAHALLWRRIMADLGVASPHLRMATTFRVYFLASLGRYIPGKVWQLAGLAILAGRAGLPAAGAAAAALLGQFAFLATGFLFLAVLLPEWSGGIPARIAGVLLVVAAGSFWLLVATPRGRSARAWAREQFGDKVAGVVDLAERLRGWDTILWGVWYGATWVVTGLAFSIFVSAFVPEAGVHARQAAGAVAASYLAGYLVLFAPAGIGVREGAMAGLLAGMPGVSTAAAVGIALASRVWFTAAELAPLAALPLLPRTPDPQTGAPPDAGAEGPPG